MEKADAQTNSAYRALGRWFVEFSRLIFHMRHAIERHLAGEQDIMIPMLALGEGHAKQITDSFFGICAYLADFNEEEARVAKLLKEKVTDEIARRNNFAHGDWWVGPNPADEGHQIDEPMLWRAKPGRKQLPSMETVPVADIDASSDWLCDLRQFVGEFGDLCMGDWPDASKFEDEVRIRHVFRIDEERRLIRDGVAAKLSRKITYH